MLATIQYQRPLSYLVVRPGPTQLVNWHKLEQATQIRQLVQIMTAILTCDRLRFDKKEESNFKSLVKRWSNRQ